MHPAGAVALLHAPKTAYCPDKAACSHARSLGSQAAVVSCVASTVSTLLPRLCCERASAMSSIVDDAIDVALQFEKKNASCKAPNRVHDKTPPLY
jgi:hypothetical protein